MIVTFTSALYLLRTLLPRIGLACFPLIAGAALLGSKNDGECSRQVRWDPSSNEYIDDGCEGTCPNGWACLELNDVLQPDGEKWWYCACNGGEVKPVTACCVILVKTAAGTWRTRCFEPNCATSCAENWSEHGDGTWLVHCNCVP
jgi:hypothetical protein